MSGLKHIGDVTSLVQAAIEHAVSFTKQNGGSTINALDVALVNMPFSIKYIKRFLDTLIR